MSQFDFHSTSIPDLRVVERRPRQDTRGFFERSFCQEAMSPVLHGKSIQQINRTLSQQEGTVRGLHFQYPPYAEIKLVSCIRGEVFDIAVDLRAESPTFLEWHGEVLSQSNCRSMVIPEGFAHGFQTLTDDCEMLYLHTAAYRPESQGVINAIDPRLSIDWPRKMSNRSERDTRQAMLTDDFMGIRLA